MSLRSPAREFMFVLFLLLSFNCDQLKTRKRIGFSSTHVSNSLCANTLRKITGNLVKASAMRQKHVKLYWHYPWRLVVHEKNLSQKNHLQAGCKHSPPSPSSLCSSPSPRTTLSSPCPPSCSSAPCCPAACSDSSRSNRRQCPLPGTPTCPPCSVSSIGLRPYLLSENFDKLSLFLNIKKHVHCMCCPELYWTCGGESTKIIKTIYAKQIILRPPKWSSLNGCDSMTEWNLRHSKYLLGRCLWPRSPQYTKLPTKDYSKFRFWRIWIFYTWRRCHLTAKLRMVTLNLR